MILHLTEDEKFIDHVIDVFEEANPLGNIYFVELQENADKLKYVKSSHPNMFVGRVDGEKFRSLVDDLTKYDAVVLHNLYNPYKQNIVRNAPDTVQFHWMCWGADLYCIDELRNDIVEGYKETDGRNLKKKLGDYLRSSFPGLWYHLYLSPRQLPRYEKAASDSSSDLEYKRLFSKIKSASTVMPQEMKLVHQYLNAEIRYVPFKYGTIEALSQGDNSVVEGNNILFGNSATASNNHFALLNKLKRSMQGDQTLFVPLSYGGQEYASKVISRFQRVLGSRFRPLTHFLPLNEYNRIFDSCGIVVMNHIRQQALGNVVFALWKGAKLYMNRKSPIYRHLKDNGIQVYPIGWRRLKPAKDNQQLAWKNRDRLMALYGREVVVDETKALVRYLIGE